MHTIEPFPLWKMLYNSSDDINSPFYKKEYNEYEYSSTIYNYYIHPKWDYIGSPTLYIKILYIDYTLHFAIIEMFGEWNDCLNNDIMFLKRDIIDIFISHGIIYYILIGENVLISHFYDDSYYEEWAQDIPNGWIVALNFQKHVIKDFINNRINNFIVIDTQFENINWRTNNPIKLFHLINLLIQKKLNP